MSERINLYFLILFIAATILVIMLFRPFVGALLLAITFAILFKPLYRFILKLTGGLPSLSALATMILVLVVIITPLTLITWQAGQEMVNAYYSYNSEATILPIKDYLTNFSLPPSLDLQQVQTEVADWLIPKISPFFGGVVKTILSIIIFFLSFFFLLRDSLYFRERIKELSPLTGDETNMVIRKLSIATNSIVRGSILVAIIQGILTGIGFTIFSVPQPLLWGLVATFAALIPGIGTALVLTPGIIYLYFTVGTVNAVGLLIWGVIAVGLIDNILGPTLVGRGVQIHPLLILLSVLGGLALFGPVGLLAGPLVLSLLFALIPIYRAKID